MNNKSYEQERMEREEKAKKTRRQLEKYTKDELLWLIETTCVVDHSANFWFLKFAVDVDSKRAESRLEAEEKAGDEWTELVLHPGEETVDSKNYQVSWDEISNEIGIFSIFIYNGSFLEIDEIVFEGVASIEK